MKNMHTGYQFLIYVAILASLALTGCSLLFQSQYSDYPLERELQYSDFPASWYRLGGTFEEVPGSEYSHIVAYAPDENVEYLMISQQLTIYSSEVDAEVDFADWKEVWFPTKDWKQPADLAYIPVDGEDWYHLACTHFTINQLPVLSCRYLQQHDEFISLLLTNIDGEEVTKEIFLAVLEAQDIRLNK